MLWLHIWITLSDEKLANFPFQIDEIGINKESPLDSMFALEQTFIFLSILVECANAWHAWIESYLCNLITQHIRNYRIMFTKHKKGDIELELEYYAWHSSQSDIRMTTSLCQQPNYHVKGEPKHFFFSCQCCCRLR